MKTYDFAEGARVPKGADPEEVGRYLERLAAQNGGELTAEDVLKDAETNKRSKLREWFEWDDSVAAYEFRLTQARNLLRIVVVRTDTPEPTPPTRLFVNISSEQVGSGSRYVETLKAMTSADKRALILAQARRELEAFRAKYGHLKELAAIFERVDEVVGAL